MEKKKSVYHQMIRFPANLVRPIRDYLVGEEKRLKDQKKRLDSEDPFKVADRENDNAAVDTEVAELIGHERVTTIKTELVDKSLINIRKALTRIKLGRYGVCGNCGKMIDTDRLAIYPTAEFCVDCERKAEKKK